MSKGLIGVVANANARYSEFGFCIDVLDKPDGWDKTWSIGLDYVGSRNDLVQYVLDNDYTHLWFMDDDHSFAPDLLTRLLAWDKPLVTPVCLTKTWPFLPCVYPNKLPEGEHQYLPLDFEGAEPSGLIEIEAGGCAGMLIRRDVLESVSAPWFEHADVGEDILFCQKAKDAGFRLYADLGAILGHITVAVVQPSYDEENGWTTGVRVGNELRLVVPFWSQLLAAQESDPRNQDDNPHPDALPPAVDVPSEHPASEAERIEIWADEQVPPRWWWRALDFDGSILKKDSAITEESVIGQAHFFYPDVMVYLIQREWDDSRNLRQFGPPQRLWDRG